MTNSAMSSVDHSQSHLHKWFPWIFASLVVVGVCIESPTALLLFVIDGLPAVLILAAATFLGARFANSLFGNDLDFSWTLLLGAALGLGLLATLVLVLGCFGLLHQLLWIALLIAFFLTGLPLLRRMWPNRAGQKVEASSWRWLMLLAVPFLALVVIVSVTPPGVLWIEEGAGYDVLEYHLQLPREYFQAQQIEYTLHNVYGNFPANAEMLYLLSMIVVDDVYAGAATAKILNAFIGMACVWAAFVIGRQQGHGVGVASAVLVGTCGWIVYLSGIAYVENLMLFFGFVATGALMRATDSELHRRRWLTMAGLLAGFACGCKYTAIPMIAVPITLMALAIRERTRQRLCNMAIVGVASLVSFCPWLIKNTILTGNPVFPLAHSVFASYPEGWGEAEANHFAESHKPGPEESSIEDRVRLAWQRIPADPSGRFGPAIFVLAGLGIAMNRRSWVDVMLAMMAVLQFLAWISLTHLYARFAVLLIIPLILLAGRIVRQRLATQFGLIVVLIVAAGAMFNGYHVVNLYRQHFYHEGERIPWEGATDFFTNGHGGGHDHLSVLNDTSFPDDAKVLMLGDAKAFYVKPSVDYCVVFNRNPFVIAVRDAKAPADVIDWLRGKGYSHVFVNWAEISRLRRSRYGFPDEVSPELFDELAPLGLTHLESFKTGVPLKRYADLYAINPTKR